MLTVVLLLLSNSPYVGKQCSDSCCKHGPFGNENSQTTEGQFLDTFFKYSSKNNFLISVSSYIHSGSKIKSSQNYH